MEKSILIELGESQLGAFRRAEIIGFRSIDFVGKTAEIIIKIYNNDENGNPFPNPDVMQEREILIPISNSDKVIDGILIEQDDPRYEGATPEFDWWMQTASQVPLIPMLEQALQMLSQTGRFDRL